MIDKFWSKGFLSSFLMVTQSKLMIVLELPVSEVSISEVMNETEQVILNINCNKKK